MSEIDQLVQEYNAAELVQQDRLTRLFLLVNARKGFRFVRFSNAIPWSNCWESERMDLTLARQVNQRTCLITEVIPGGE